MNLLGENIHGCSGGVFRLYFAVHMKPIAPALLLLVYASSCAVLPREAPTCEDTEDHACFTGAFRTLLGVAVEGVEVCPEGLSDISCTTSDQEGQWMMPGLPRGTNLAIEATHPDYVPTLFPQHSDMDWYGWVKVAVPPFVVETHASRLSAELDPSKGNILFLTWEGLNIDGVDTPNVPGVTAETGDEGGTLFYADAIGLASPTADATTGSGAGGLLNVQPGVTRLRFSGPGGICSEQMFHWAAEEDGLIPVPVTAGYTTAIDVRCPVAP